MRFNYKSYSDIPEGTKKEILWVSEEKNIEDVTLEDINGWLNMLEEMK